MRTVQKVAAAAAAILGVWAFASSASAAFVSLDYHTGGDGLITFDSLSGLEFLDFSVSLGQTPTTALGANPGFRLATRTEVETLFGHFGLSSIGTGATVAADFAAGQQFDSLFGNTLSAFNGAVRQSQGHVLNAQNTVDLFLTELRTSPASPTGFSTQFIGLGNVLGSGSSVAAEYLVRAGGVPEPGAWSLMLAGFGGVGALLRRRRDCRALFA